MTSSPPAPPLTPEEIAEGRRLIEKARGATHTEHRMPLEWFDAGDWFMQYADRLLSCAERLAEAEATIARLEGRMCLICGRANEAGCLTPECCTFDPDPIKAAQDFQRRLAECERESADRAAVADELQGRALKTETALAEVERQLAEADAVIDAAMSHIFESDGPMPGNPTHVSQALGRHASRHPKEPEPPSAGDGE